MKKLIFLSLAAIAAITVMSSCEKDGTEKDANDKDYLVKTKWVDSGTETSGSVPVTWTEVFSFDTKTTGTFSYEDTDVKNNESGTFTYTYDPPTVTMIGNDGDPLVGIISGNTMTIPEWDGQVFTKQ